MHRIQPSFVEIVDGTLLGARDDEVPAPTRAFLTTVHGRTVPLVAEAPVLESDSGA